MSLSRRTGLVLKGAALWAGMAVAVLCIVLAAIGFLAAAFVIWLAQHMNHALAAALTAGALLLLALIIGLGGALILRSNRLKLLSLRAEFGGTLAIARLAALWVRGDPKKAMILSLIAGALAEYVLGERKR